MTFPQKSYSPAIRLYDNASKSFCGNCELALTTFCFVCFCRLALSHLKDSPNLIILGKRLSGRLPIFSFVVQHPDSGRLLHHNFICAVLNDVFGIQARGGCACAGPYAQVNGNINS